MINKKCEELADIICGFRSGEIAKIDAKHVKKWIDQFENNVQIPILEEMIYIFSDWYLMRDYINDEYFDKIPTILQNKYSFKSEYETLKNVSFVNIQNVGQSQKILIAELKKIKHEQYGVDLLCDINSSINHYVYIDDGFYSSRARKDIKEVIYQLKPGDTLDVFYLVICSSGFMFAKDEFKRLSNECKVDIKFHPLATIDNERREHTEYKDGTETVWWMKNHMCLRPSQSSKSDNEINMYYNYLHTLTGNCEKYPYRCSHWINDEGVFSSADRRSLVEHEFLKKGIQIVNSYPNNKGMYPLEYNLWPSFGFGVLFATEYNFHNNAPLVIWAETSNWYPLLPRRVNNQSDIIDTADMYDYEKVYSKPDQCNMCPDCGNLFGLDGDGGNGFCIECVWKH